MTLTPYFWLIIPLIAAWILIWPRWTRGLYAMVCYIPVAGIISLKLYTAVWTKELLDFLFIMPAYISFIVHPDVWRRVKLQIPRIALVCMGTLVVLVLIEAFNPHILNWRVAAIGIKVWLFYLPLMVLGYYWIETEKQLVRLLRLLVVLAWIPTLVGFVEFVGSHWFGYRPFMTLFYGPMADAATQGFVFFSLGDGTLIRIPSTFAFSTQYMNYLTAMTTFSYAHMRSESASGWKLFGSLSFYWILLATYLSGSRAAFVITPLLVIALCLYDRPGLRSIPKVVGSLVLIYFALKLPTLVLSAKQWTQQQSNSINTLRQNTTFTQHSQMPVTKTKSEFTPTPPKETADINFHIWSRMMKSLIVDHGYNVGYLNISSAFHGSLIGKGVGMNTGAARYAVPDPSKLSGFENYYAKTYVELGVLGFSVIVLLLGSIWISGFRIYWNLSDGPSRQMAAAIGAFLATFILYNFKGVMIDFDPINVYFWLMAGLLFKLPLLTQL